MLAREVLRLSSGRLSFISYEDMIDIKGGNGVILGQVALPFRNNLVFFKCLKFNIDINEIISLIKKDYTLFCGIEPTSLLNRRSGTKDGSNRCKIKESGYAREDEGDCFDYV